MLSGDTGTAAGLVRTLIQDSWGRCATGGIDVGKSEAPLESDKSQIEQLTHANRDLLAAASRSFSALGRMLTGTGAMLVLGDREGVLIETIGDQRTIHAGMDIHLGIGGQWTEDVIGTNGIGTALRLGEPVFVHAAEHFCSGIRAWTCAGAPIRDPLDGSILGVVDLSGHPEIFRPHNIALVAAAAREIEKALAEQIGKDRIRLLEAFIASAPGYRNRDGLMIVDRRGRSIYHRNLPDDARRELLETSAAPTADDRLLIKLPEITAAADYQDMLPPGLRSCHISPLQFDDGLRGAALVFPWRSPNRQTQGGLPATRVRSSAAEDAAAGIVGESEALLEAVDIACRVGGSPEVTSVLIDGETGVGKELFARLIHTASRHGPGSPFVALNCGAITRELFGSELFGHVAGAFTGAAREGKPGVFELANGGVLSLDEIGEMPLEIQPFLLRVLEDRIVHRIGDGRGRPVAVRLVASTNRDLKKEVEAGRFRRDLYYRISTVTISVPPLRERGGDVELLVDHLNRRLAGKLGVEPLEFASAAMDALMAYRWPGNVRELKNLIERLHILSRGGPVGLRDLPAEIVSAGLRPAETHAAGRQAVRSIEDAEREAILDALAASDGNLSRAAQSLGISRPTLYRKISQHDLRRTFA
ncbi:MAG: sigma-54-dependent Fis family transcriptional regulator [Rhizobiaceae bacterium]|nr:sigma-54-dependent Fis family transcriptional regulator [Rhizobiaceae bacterium]